MTFTMVPLRGTYTGAVGAPRVGTVTAQPLSPMVKGAEVAGCEPVTRPLDATGSVTVMVRAGDDEGVLPEGGCAYRITVRLAGLADDVFSIMAPGRGGPIDLLTAPRLTPAELPAPLRLVEDVAQRGVPGGYASLNENGLIPAELLPAASGGTGVTSVNGKSGDVIIDARDFSGMTQEQADARYVKPADIPVKSVNGQTGDVVISAGGAGGIRSVNGKTQADIVLAAADVGAFSSTGGTVQGAVTATGGLRADVNSTSSSALVTDSPAGTLANLAVLRAGGADKFIVTPAGDVTASGKIAASGTASAPSLLVGGASATLAGAVGGAAGMANVTTAPTTTPANGVVVFAQNGVLKVRQQDGTTVIVGTSGSSGGSSGSTDTVAAYTMSTNTSIPLPLTASPASGQVHRVHALASGAQRVATFDAAYVLTDQVTSRTFTIPSSAVLIAQAEYSHLLNGWALTRAVVTAAQGSPGDEGGTGKPVVSAGANITTTDPMGTITRTATESGGTPTSRAWTIVSGPMGSGTTIGTAAALSWVPGSSPAGTSDIRQPVFMEMCFEIVSTAENSTLDWTSAYKYIEDIGDNRGYTAGLVGFTSATHDMLQLVQQYTAQKPGNPLASYIPGLQQCAAVGFGPGASNAATTYLGAAFKTAWVTAANTDPVFRKCQRDMRKSLYWDDCLVQALADKVSPLGLALYYDILVNHGVGNDSQSFGGILAAGRSSTTKPPSQGGTEKEWLLKLCDLRDDVLRAWGDYQVNGRSTIYRGLANAGNFNLTTPFSWSVYGDNYTLSARPSPPADARLGAYTLRYTASNSSGSATSDLTVTVNETGTGGETPPATLLSTLADNFNAAGINTTLWPNNYGTPAPTQTGGRARVPCGTDYCAFSSASIYTLAGSSMYVRVYPPAKSTAVEDAYAAVEISSPTVPAGTTLSVVINQVSGRIRFNSNVGFWDNTADATQQTYSATTHAWIRIREAAGTLYFDTSTDGTTWTNRRSMATPAWVTSANNLRLSLSAHRDAGVADFAEFDNINTLT